MEKDFALELYKLFRGELYDSLKLHRETLQHYLAFTVAVLGATIVGILGVRGMGWIGIVIIVGPILNVVICTLAIRMCGRFYLHVLQRITISMKLEAILGLRDSMDFVGPNQGEREVFTRDIYLLPEGWVVGAQYPTSEDFVQIHLNSGVNRVAKQTFHLLIVVNVLLIIATVIVALY